MSRARKTVAAKDDEPAADGAKPARKSSSAARSTKAKAEAPKRPKKSPQETVATDSESTGAAGDLDDPAVAEPSRAQAHRDADRGFFRMPRKLVRFLGYSLAKARQDEIPNQSATLAFITLLSLVPLLAALSYFSAGFFADNQLELVDLLGSLLPYNEVKITQSITQFLEQSKQLRGIAFFAFLITALSAFSAIEKIINDIWNVTARRTLRSRLSSFVQLLFFGPILIVGTYSGVFFLARTPTYQMLQGSVAMQLLIELVPTFVTIVGLTILYWQVPNTRVRFRSALAGGVLAGLLIHGLRQGFAIYVDATQNISTVYGTFGLLLLFMISVQLTWAIVLLGSELAYCTQNFEYMARRRRDVGVLEGSWLGLAALVLVMESFREKKPITPHEDLAVHLGVPVVELRKVLRPLADAGLLLENQGEEDGYMLASDPYQVRVDQVFDLYEDRQWHLLAALPDVPAAHLETLRHRLTEARDQAVGDLPLTALLTADPSDAEESAEAT